MGSCLSCRLLRCKSSSSSSISIPPKTIRLVHLSGYVEDLEPPVTVSQVISMSPKHFVCTAAQLLTTGSIPLKLDDQLQSGTIYFVIPQSIFESDTSPMDFASLVKKLTAKAKSVDPKSTRVSPTVSFKMMASPSASVVKPSWKPILDSIREISFSFRSESDLPEKYSFTAS